MKGYLNCWNGQRLELPEPLSWRFRYGTGTPCDSFELECAWGTAIDGALSNAVGFEAVEGGGTVFRGVVDEYEYRWE